MTHIKTSRDDGQPQLSFGEGLPLGWEAVAAHDLLVQARQLDRLSRALGRLANSNHPDDVDDRQAIDARYSYDRHGLIGLSKSGNECRSLPIIEYLAGLEIGQLLNFVIENKMRFDQQANATGQASEFLQSQVEIGATQLGELTPKFRLADYQSALGRASHIAAIDSFEAGGMHANGLYMMQCGSDRITLSNLFDDRPNFRGPGRNMQRTTFHEYTHATGDHTDKGLFSGLTGEPGEPSLWLLEEPVVSYLTDYATSDDRMSKPGSLADCHSLSSYQGERELLDNLGVTPELAAEAFFSKPDDISSARKDLRKLLDKAVADNFPELGDNASFYQLAERYEASPRHLRYKLLTEWNNRLNEFSEDIDPNTLSDIPFLRIVPAAYS